MCMLCMFLTLIAEEIVMMPHSSKGPEAATKDDRECLILDCQLKLAVEVNCLKTEMVA